MSGNEITGEKRMRVLIDHGGYECKNVGDIAMLKVAILRIQEMFDYPDIHIFTDDPEKLSTLCPRSVPVPVKVSHEGRSAWCSEWNIFGGLHKLVPLKFHSKLVNSEHWLRLKFPRHVKDWISFRLRKRDNTSDLLNAYYELVNESDIVLAAGGGYITDSFERHALLVLSTLGLAQSLGKPTYLYGQGLGPIQSPLLTYLAKQILPRARIIALREKLAGVKVLEAAGAKDNFLVTGDDAIELAYHTRFSQLGNKIGINLRISNYSNFDSEFIAIIREVVRELSQVHHTEVTPIPISCHSEDSDVKSLQTLLGNSVQVDCPKSPKTIIELCSECRVVITGSYHAGLFALSQGVSVIGLAGSQYYVDKFTGLKEQFGPGCNLVEFPQDNFKAKLSETITQVWSEAEENRNSLLKHAERQLELGRQAFFRMRDFRD